MSVNAQQERSRASGRPPSEFASGKGKRLLAVEHVEIGYQVDGSYQVAVGDVSFDIHEGEKIMLLGPSGCGKSTLLKAIAGFLEPSKGSIQLEGRASLEPGPDRAVVFQEFDQLFPWRNVLGNVAYPLRVTGRPKDEALAEAQRFVEMMGLTDSATRFPHQLSGGMKQRVAIARAFALHPVMLLMDEPFGSLDAQTRSRLQRELISIAAKTDVTLLFVTHSIQEAILIGDRIVVLGQAPSEVLDIVDVSAVSDPDTDAFVEVRKSLRTRLSDGTEGDDAITE